MQQYYVFKLYSWVMFYRKYPSALSSTGTIICGELEKSKCLVANSWIARAKARCISKKKTKNKKHVWHIMLPGSLSLVKSKSRPLNLCIGLKSVCKCCKQVESTYSFIYFFFSNTISLTTSTAKFLPPTVDTATCQRSDFVSMAVSWFGKFWKRNAWMLLVRCSY